MTVNMGRRGLCAALRAFECLPNLDPTDIADSFLDVLTEVNVCSVATVLPEATPYLSNAFVCLADDLTFGLLLDRESAHRRNVDLDDRARIAICHSKQAWDGCLRGLAFSGTLKETDDDALEGIARSYRLAYPAFEAWESLSAVQGPPISSSFYSFQTVTFSLIDYGRLGEEVVVRGRRNADAR